MGERRTRKEMWEKTKRNREEKDSSTGSKKLWEISNSNFSRTADCTTKEKESEKEIKHVEAQIIIQKTKSPRHITKNNKSSSPMTDGT